MTLDQCSRIQVANIESGEVTNIPQIVKSFFILRDYLIFGITPYHGRIRLARTHGKIDCSVPHRRLGHNGVLHGIFILHERFQIDCYSHIAIVCKEKADDCDTTIGEGDKTMRMNSVWRAKIRRESFAPIPRHSSQQSTLRQHGKHRGTGTDKTITKGIPASACVSDEIDAKALTPAPQACVGSTRVGAIDQGSIAMGRNFYPLYGDIDFEARDLLAMTKDAHARERPADNRVASERINITI